MPDAPEPVRAAPDVGAALSVSQGALWRDGLPHQVIAGSMHYFRVHPAQWRDRMLRLADLGVNALDTYVAWNFHERVEGEPRFDGWRDLERYLGIAEETGLDVVLRPGPYICAEWDNGGLPAWLTGREGIRLRSADPAFLDPMRRWFDALLPRVLPLQAAQGGPIVAVQVENEFGSFGHDPAYLAAVRDALVERGIVELLFTADGATDAMQQRGALPGVLATATFGSHPGAAAALMRRHRADEPFVCAEFWNGWFDHWGENHHVRSATDAAGDIATIVSGGGGGGSGSGGGGSGFSGGSSGGGSVSIYMAHGGTNFGLWAGANHDGTALQPTATSYDSDAPIAENGGLTPKYDAIRTALLPYAVPAGSEFDSAPRTLRPRVMAIHRGRGLLDGLGAAGAAIESRMPPTFDELGVAHGMLLHATRLAPGPDTVLTLTGLHDRATVFVDGVPVGVAATETAEVSLAARRETVDLHMLVENRGRINYGPLLGQGKGILGGVALGGHPLEGWRTTPLELDEWSPSLLSDCRTGTPRGASGFAVARLDAETRADAFLAFPGFGRGFVWVGEVLLGRYDSAGPQRTLYVPAPLLVPGENVITVLELDRFGTVVELHAHADLGPREEFVELL